jgi:hypothetical protein
VTTIIVLGVAAAVVYMAIGGVAMRLLEEAGLSEEPAQLGAFLWPAALAISALWFVTVKPYQLTDRLITGRKRPALPAAKVVQR